MDAVAQSFARFWRGVGLNNVLGAIPLTHGMVHSHDFIRDRCENSALGATMNLRRAYLLTVLGLLSVFPACGGSSNTNFNNVVLTVSPSAATTTTGQQVSLKATITGVPGTPALSWSIVELQTGGASGAQCNWAGSTPPAGPCPDGTIQGADVPPNTNVTYNAPGTTGTFHIQVQWSTAFTPVITKTATATVTVN